MQRLSLRPNKSFFLSMNRAVAIIRYSCRLLWMDRQQTLGPQNPGPFDGLVERENRGVTPVTYQEFHRGS